jgi:mono/diheme cytochrome c family protein
MVYGPFTRLVAGIAVAVLGLVAGLAAGAAPPTPAGGPQASASASEPAVAYHAFLKQYCVTCHNDRLRTANLSLETASLGRVSRDTETWEKVLAKLRTQAMPPPGRPRPSVASYAAFGSWLETALDRAASANPNPGRPTVRRLNRLEYANAVRDLLAVEVDGAALLPADDMAYGFDNNADMQTLTSGLLERYLAAASQIVRLAIGEVGVRPGIHTYRVSRMNAQTGRASEALPFGTRGGAVIRHHFPVAGEYVVRVYSQGSIGGDARPPSEPEQLEVRLDGAYLRMFTLEPASPPTPGDSSSRRTTQPPLEVRFAATAGPHLLGVAFVERLAAPEGVAPASLPVGNVRFEGIRGAETRVGRVEIEGPFAGAGLGDTLSRRRIFQCRPARPEEEEGCATTILKTLARRAYRRPVTESDVDELLGVFRTGRKEGADFEVGIKWALERLLIDPDFLYRAEPDPSGAASGSAYRLTDLQLASRLSFFLWSSVPDDELLEVAAGGRLSDVRVLEHQVRRMLRDPRSSTLATNFAGQWLHLRNLGAVAPDVNAFPEFDDNLREAFQLETELFFEHQLRSDRRVVELLTANYTFLNERLARHYGVPGVFGSHFRPVQLNSDVRRGLLGHGSVLKVTSYATRTSPVLRGKWVLDNILGAPPPPPPPNVPELEDNKAQERPRSIRERMERHRANPVCASCHTRMDPLGFALENFDAIGKWRPSESGVPIDASGSLPDGTSFEGPSGLRQMLAGREQAFVATVTTKLLTYALGRGVEHYDMPAIRKIVRDTGNESRWSSIIMGIVKSVPFQMRRAAS